MVTKEDLLKTYSKFSNQELLDVLDNKFDYTELAISVALDEISRRNTLEDEIREYKEGIIRKIDQYVERNIVNDLALFQKIFFFFLWILSGPFRMNFSEDGYILKLKQANYYSLLGFLSFILTGLLSAILHLSNFFSIIVWVLFFIISYSFDEYFNREKLRKKLVTMFETEGKDES